MPALLRSVFPAGTAVAVLVLECANMRNGAEAAVVSSAAGRDRYAARFLET